MKVTRFDHITIAVRDLDAAIETFIRCFNLEARDHRRVKHLGMENVFWPFGDGAIELSAPLKEPGAPDQIRRFLERRGEGMMNLCLTVEDIQESIHHLEKCGVRVLQHTDADDQKAAVTTDTYLGKTYPGRVSYISSKAEFTPKTVETFKERVTLVYRTKVRVDNPNYELKPGMPAEAVVETDK